MRSKTTFITTDQNTTSMVLHENYADAPNRAYTEQLGEIGGTATVKVALLSAAHTKDVEGNETWDDVSADEVTGTGYDAGGQEIANDSLIRTGANTVYDGDDVLWSDSTIDAGHAVVYEDTGTDTTSSLLTHIDFEGEESSENGDFEITWDAAGIFEIQT